MQQLDYSPPARPTLGQQEAALRQGLGRAVLWARTGQLERGLLLQACLNDWRFDRQIDERRGDWLWDMVVATGSVDALRGPLIEAFATDPDFQHCQLAKHYSAQGEDVFRRLVYEAAERDIASEEPAGLATDEVLALDGEAGFLALARRHGERLASRAWDWTDHCLCSDGVELFGDDRVRELLSAAWDFDLARVREGWEQERRKDAERERKPHNPSAAPLHEILKELDSGQRSRHAMGWGYRASCEDLEVVAERLWAATEKQEILNCLRVFARRAMPRFDVRMLAFCSHADTDIRRTAYTSVENNAHPAVREFALEQLRGGVRDAGPLGLLIHNYHPGDEQLLLNALTKPTDQDQWHWMLGEIDKILGEHPSFDASQLGPLLFAENPCSFCRKSTAGKLKERGQMPDWMRAECAWDADPETRKLGEGE